ncbi:ATP-grasp domain-containing protein, partial [Durusdinium trenchii]
QARGLTQHLPKRYMSAECADYPCILKQAHGEFGKECNIVHSPEDVCKVTPQGLGTRWVLQELVHGRFEVSTTVLADFGHILDEVSTCYEYDSETYVWPRCRGVSKSLYSVPHGHLKIFEQFLESYSGICNFNYKVRDGELRIFELNTRIGGDLAVDAPRERARRLFEKLDAHWCISSNDTMPEKQFAFCRSTGLPQ